MEIRTIKEKIREEELRDIAQKNYGEMVKAVVDIEKEIMVLGGEFHSDANEVLIKEGSEQKNIWGINIYPYKKREDWIEFISLINIRPADNNLDMEIKSKEVKEKIKKIVEKLT
ncbi:MAG: hypothetical protein FJZ07_00930 [Candidatus Nealsonbacteria bacterium]|nr:hypothetical protein [Candidatus Nealsonbacteria bacterium]